MSLFDKLMKAGGMEKETTVCAPIAGEAIDLKDVNDGVFSEEILGKGCAVIPSADEVCAPFDGEVVMTFPTGHAVGVKNKAGVEILIHIGLDTVNMNGDGFTVHVRQGDQVECGDPLVSFSREKIKKAGLIDTTMVIVSNTKDFKEVNFAGRRKVEQRDPLFTVVK